MNFLATCAVLIALFVGLVWYTGDSSRSSDSPLNFSSFFKDELIESVRSHPVNSDAIISLSNVNGSVKIVGHEHNTVVLQVTKRGDKTHFQNAHAEVAVALDHVSINSVYDNRRDHQNVSIEYDLKVPATAHVSLIKTINGSIVLINTNGPVAAKTTNGEIIINNARGPIEAHTVNGSISIKNSTDALNAESVNGKITVAIQKCTQGAILSLQTTSGSLALTAPIDLSAKIKAETTNGIIHSDFPLTKEHLSFTGSRIETTIGEGKGGIITLSTTHGNISLKHPSDEKE